MGALPLLLVAAPLVAACSLGSAGSSPPPGGPAAPASGPGCTVLYAADETVALGGSNEDHGNPDTYVWFVPALPGEYGRVYFGYEDGFPQGGVNEAGLFFDGLALPYRPLPWPDDRPVYDGAIPRGSLLDKIMSGSATVAEAAVILNSYSQRGMDTYQLLFGDAAGSSMIVEGEAILPRQGSFQIATNFRLSEHPDPPYPCQRYMLARGRLSTAKSFSVGLCRDILDATHQEPPGPTLYSTIYDLRNGLIYLYYHHDFENAVVIEVAGELAKGFHASRLSSLFPANEEAAAFEREFADLAANLAEQIARRVTPLEPERLTEYAGPYRVRLGAAGEAVSLYVDAGRLYAHQRFSLPIELLPEAEDRFFHLFRDGSEMTIAFSRDDRGAIAGATGELYGEWFRLERVAPSAATGGPAPAIPWWIWPLVAGALVAGAAGLIVGVKGRPGG